MRFRFGQAGFSSHHTSLTRMPVYSSIVGQGSMLIIFHAGITIFWTEIRDSDP